MQITCIATIDDVWLQTPADEIPGDFFESLKVLGADSFLQAVYAA